MRNNLESAHDHLWMQVINKSKSYNLSDLWKGQPVDVFNTEHFSEDGGVWHIAMESPSGELIGWHTKNGRAQILCRYSHWYIPINAKSRKAFELRQEWAKKH